MTEGILIGIAGYRCWVKPTGPVGINLESGDPFALASGLTRMPLNLVMLEVKSDEMSDASAFGSLRLTVLLASGAWLRLGAQFFGYRPAVTSVCEAGSSGLGVDACL